MLNLLIRKSFSSAQTHTPILIVGGGSAGINLMGHLLRQKGVAPHDMRILDPSKYHYYQPGWTMIGGGLCESSLTTKEMRKIVNKWVPLEFSAVKKVDPKNNLVQTEDNKYFSYDHLVLATGLKLDWHKIKGAIEALEDPDCPVGSIYDIKYAEKINRIAENFTGGRAVFTEPTLPIKCGGAPQKIVYLTDDRWRKKGIRTHSELVFRKAAGVYFPVPRYAAELEKHHKEKNVAAYLNSNLIEINKNERIAIFENPVTKERVTEKFDFLHIVPPQSAPTFIQASGLATPESGFVNVNIQTLRHNNFENIWSFGDSANLPTSKTAAALMTQGPILTKNLMRAWKLNEKSNQIYDGYTSCPIFVGNNKLMLAEFKYNNVVDETFLSNQNKANRLFYYLKRYFFPWVYFKLMPRGLWLGRKGFGTSLY